MAAKRYLFTPGPTPVPPEVLAALAEPVVHHRGPDYRALFGECLERLRAVYRTASDVLLFTCVGHGRDGVRGREPLLARRPRRRRLGGRLRRALADARRARTAPRCRPSSYEWGETPRRGGPGREAGRGRRREGRVPDALRDVDRSRRRRPGTGRGGEGVRRARRRRRRLEPRRRPARDRRVGARRRRLRLAEGADDAARDRARLGLRGCATPRSARRRASTSTGSGRAPGRRSWTARSRLPSRSSEASTSRSGCCSRRGSKPRSTGTFASAAHVARVRRRWGSSCSRPTRTARRS